MIKFSYIQGKIMGKQHILLIYETMSKRKKISLFLEVEPIRRGGGAKPPETLRKPTLFFIKGKIKRKNLVQPLNKSFPYSLVKKRRKYRSYDDSQKNVHS